MQDQSPREILCINTAVEKTLGNDVTFTVNLGTNYHARVIQLDQFATINLFSNMPLKYQNWSILVGINNVPINLGGFHFNIAQLIAYINSIQNYTVLSYTMSPTSILTINSTNNFQMLGAGWTMLGFTNQATQAQAITQVAQLYPTMQQSPVFYLRFDNLPNAQQGDHGMFSFMIPNDSTFGATLLYEPKKDDQVVYLPCLQSFQQISMTLLDQYLQPVQTNPLNNVGIPLHIKLSIFGQ